MKHPYEQERKLAAIMFTDIMNFSKIMGQDEDRALKILERHKEILLPVISDFMGTPLKFMGDGILIEFKSGVMAVRCAIKIQEMLNAHNKGLPESQIINLRIGIHTGDVVVMDKDIYGEGVNIASRLQPLADSGGICISQSVYDAVRNRVEVQTVSLGKKELKNIKNAIGIYKVIIDASGVDLPEESILNKETPAPKISLENTRKISLYLLSAIVAIALLIFRTEIHDLIFPDSTPTQLEFQGKIIKAMNIHGELVWTYELENDIKNSLHPITGKIHYYVKYLIENLDNKKGTEIIISYKTTAELHKSAYIICLSQDGNLLWENKIGKRLNYHWDDRSKYLEDNYSIQDLQISDNNHDELKEVFVASSQSPYFPDFLSIYDYQGNLMGEYLNHGTISRVIHYDLDGDGINEIIIGGQSNVHSFLCPYFAVLDFKRVSGQSPLYHCLDVPKGTEKFYILLPRVSFANKYTPRGNTTEIRILKNKIEVVVLDGNEDISLTSFFYFDFDLNFIEGTIGDNIIVAVEKLKREGYIKTTIKEENELLQHPLYWNGDSLQEISTINKNWMRSQ